MSGFDCARTESPSGTIGVLNLQGDVLEHLDHIERIGIPCRPVKHTEEFENLSGLIIPGGESTCLSRLLRIFGLDQIILGRYKEGMKIWGTCAGAILLARIIKGESPHLGLLDVEIERNSFGSQLDSFSCIASVPEVSPSPMPLTFIRAPKITCVGDGVNILLRMDDFIAAAESPGVLATVFHPELTPSLEFHRYFARKCGLIPLPKESAPSAWDRTSWMKAGKNRIG
ncbi:MAG: pyridoxal 5'-phosphate synthase glutaminase subunit PdxT [Syntrophales bacterium]